MTDQNGAIVGGVVAGVSVLLFVIGVTVGIFFGIFVYPRCKKVSCMVPAHVQACFLACVPTNFLHYHLVPRHYRRRVLAMSIICAI